MNIEIGDFSEFRDRLRVRQPQFFDGLYGFFMSRASRMRYPSMFTKIMQERCSATHRDSRRVSRFGVRTLTALRIRKPSVNLFSE